MDIVTILRIGGYVLAGLGAGYWMSILLCRAAANATVKSRCRMAVLGGLAGVGLAATTIVIDAQQAPPLDKLTTEIELDRALANSAGTPVVVDFYADWCPPCRTLKPTVERLQRRWGGRIKFYRINVDDSFQLKKRFDIRSIPTLVYFQGADEMDRTIGVVGAAQIELRLVRLLEAADRKSQAVAAVGVP